MIKQSEPDMHCQMCGSTDSSVEIPPANAIFIEWEYLCKQCQRKLSSDLVADAKAYIDNH